MATIGKWGVARDADGKLANIYEWPWYWRYPVAAIGIASVIAAALHMDPQWSSGKPQWGIIIVAILWALLALSVAYELALLLTLWLLIWGAMKIVGAVTPESWQKASKTELVEVRDIAANALFIAQQAKAAIDDGTGSGSTIGEEVEEAKEQAESAMDEAANAKSEAERAQAEVDELRDKLDAICNRAPALCY